MRALVVAAVLAAACGPAGPAEPDLRALRLPTGVALSPGGDWLFVSNGNWDRADESGTLVAIDVRRLDEGIADPRGVGNALTPSRPCRATADRVECDPAALIDDRHSIRLPSGAGNIGVDRPKGPDGPLRLLVPTRIEPAVTWVDVAGWMGSDLDVSCDQDVDAACGEAHRIPVADEPARLAVDEQGFRFAYLPHLLESDPCEDDCAGLTLIALDGELGPEVTDIEQDFFREDPVHDSGLRGGFSIAQRACDTESGNVPAESRNCTRPVLYASQRFWAGVRVFRVATGLDVMLPGRESSFLGVNVGDVAPRPLMGDLEFEDLAAGERLLVVHTTPPGLSRVDTSLDPGGTPVDDLMQSVPVCNNPNIVEVHRPADGERLAFVSCYGAARVAVVGLSSFSIVASLALGAGPNEMAVDEARRRLYVVNTLESTISVVELDRASPRYLREAATIGLHADRTPTGG